MNKFVIRKTNEIAGKPWTVFAKYDDGEEYVDDYASRAGAKLAAQQMQTEHNAIEAADRRYASGYACAAGYRD